MSLYCLSRMGISCPLYTQHPLLQLYTQPLRNARKPGCEDFGSTSEFTTPKHESPVPESNLNSA